jgi:ribonuclease BN (tRNA processing enzyme)
MTSIPHGGFRLTVLGAGPAYSDRPGSTGAAYLFRTERSSLLVDLGQGSFPALASRVEPESLDGIVISHLHPDHFIDLVALRHYLVYQLSPSARLRVHAPAGLAQRIDDLHAEAGFTRAAFDVVDLSPGKFEVGDFVVEAGLVTHTTESDSFGFRLAVNGRAVGVAYSGDCGRADDLLPLIHDGDALLSEVSFGSESVAPGAQHLNGPIVGDLATRARAGRVLLTHLQMGFDRDTTIAATQERFSGPIDLVDPGFETGI